jgi:hypothetical protein
MTASVDRCWKMLAFLHHIEAMAVLREVLNEPRND